jgi:hypothetical protein
LQGRAYVFVSHIAYTAKGSKNRIENRSHHHLTLTTDISLAKQNRPLRTSARTSRSTPQR